MSDKRIERVKAVWQSQNNIANPQNTELTFNVVDQVAGLFSAGSFYYYVLNFVNLQMEFVSDKIYEILGIDTTQLSLDKILNLLHPDDLNRMPEKESTIGDFLFNKIPIEDIPLYKVVYLMRLRHNDGSYKTILHQAKALTVSDDGKIIRALGIHTDVSYLNIPVDHKVSFISTERPSYYSQQTGAKLELVDDGFNNLFTAREKEILKKIAEGETFIGIAQLLNVSPHTINTHKKNILKKTDCKNTTELIARCIRQGVI
jgi:DNA-binding CsgD family transcriptional regulator